MRCLGCPEHAQHEDQKVHVFRKLLLCASCLALAQHAEQELNRARDRAHEQSLQWLEQHILQGGLYKGGSGMPEKV